MNSAAMKQILLLLGVLAGAGATSWAINNFPVISTQDPKWKTAIQVGGGLALIFLTPGKWTIAKVAGVGAVTAGGMGAIEKFSGGKIKMLAGAGNRALGDREIAALRALGNMRAPVRIETQNRMGAPVRVMQGAGWGGGW